MSKRSEGPKLYRRKDSPHFWIVYRVHGKLHRESTNSSDEKEANRFLKGRMDQLGADRMGLRKFVGHEAEKIKVGQLLDMLKADFQIREIRSLRPTLNLLEQTRIAFGDYKAKEITQDLVNAWVLAEKKKLKHMSNATMNRRITMLGQALKMGHDRGYSGSPPHLRGLSELGRARQGFFERWEIEAIIENSPDYLKDFIRFGALTGWRKGEIASLTWADVDLQGKAIRLRAEHSKNGHARTVALEGALWEVIESRKKQQQDAARSKPYQEPAQNVPVSFAAFVFHRNGL